MPSNNSKYSEEMRERTAVYVIESGKSATSVAEEMGVHFSTKRKNRCLINTISVVFLEPEKGLSQKSKKILTFL